LKEGGDKYMSLLPAIDISASGMSAQRMRMNVIANNIANVNTTRTEKGGPYRRQVVVFKPKGREFRYYLPPFARGEIPQNQIGTGVRIERIVEDMSPLVMRYDPHHPDANAEGYVAMPNVNIVTEMVDIIDATRAYEANVAVIESAKNMALKALNIIT